MTTDREALLAAILEAPEDDTLRLIYADWLEEHVTYESVCPECNGVGTVGTLAGTMGCHRCSTGYKERGTGIIPGNGFVERAEFIRVQIELAKNAVVFEVPKDHVLSIRKYTKENIRELAGKGSVTMQGIYFPCLSVGDYLRFQPQWDVPDSRVIGVRLGGIDEPEEIEFEHENIEIPADTIDAWQSHKMRARESELYRSNYREWFSSIAWLLQPSWVDDRVKRGFVFLEEIHCTISNWLTHGESIVREHPIQKVVCTDKEPFESIAYRGTFAWFCDGHKPDSIPMDLFELLESKLEHPPREPQQIWITDKPAKYYPSQQAALDDLSQALIRYAKEKAKRATSSARIG